MSKQAKPVHAHAFPMQNTSWSGPPAPSAHVHKLPQQVLKPRDSVALREVQHPHNGRTSMNRLPLMKQEILSHYPGCFEGIGQFSGEPYKFHLKPEHKPARHVPRKVPIHLEDAFKEEIKSLVELGILEEVTEYTDWVNSYLIVEKDSGNHHAPIPPLRGNWGSAWILGIFMKHWRESPIRHTLLIKSLQNLKVAQDIFQSKLDAIFIGMEGVTGIADDMVIAGRDEMEHDRNFLAFMEKCKNNDLTLNAKKIQFKQSQVFFHEHCWLKQGISPDPKKI